MQTMVYDGHVYIADADETMPVRVYLPGTPCVVSDLDVCPYCDNVVSEAGSADVRTSDVVLQHPASGRHDGLVTFLYGFGPNGPLAEQDVSHLRCVTEGSVLTIGDVEGTDRYGYGRHAAGTPRVLAGVAIDA